MRVAGFVLILCALPLLTGCGSDSGSEAERMAEEHEGDTPTATEAAQAPKIPVEGRTVTYGQQNGTARTGYLAAPADVDSVRSARGGDALPGALPARGTAPWRWTSTAVPWPKRRTPRKHSWARR
jgi:carboxymethylenebutenolidase